MNLFIKNRTFKDRFSVTLVLPIMLLVLSATSLYSFHPSNDAAVARIFGMGEKTTLTVDSVRNKKDEIDINPRSSYDCDHWVARGTYNNKEYYAIACEDQVPAPKVGSKIEVIVAPNDNEASLVAKGDRQTPANKTVIIGLFVLAILAIMYSIRLLYIGYSSNWFVKNTRK